MADELDSIVIMNDEDGNEIRFQFLDSIDYKGGKYVVLLPMDEEDDDVEIVILRVEELDDENEAYVSVDNDETLNAVYDLFTEKVENNFRS